MPIWRWYNYADPSFLNGVMGKGTIYCHPNGYHFPSWPSCKSSHPIIEATSRRLPVRKNLLKWNFSRDFFFELYVDKKRTYWPLLALRWDLRTPPYISKFRAVLQRMPTNPPLLWIGSWDATDRPLLEWLMLYPLQKKTHSKPKVRGKNKTKST